MKTMALILLLGTALFALHSATFTTLPKTLQFFTRDSMDSGSVVIAGSVTTADAESLIVTTLEDGIPKGHAAQKLIYLDGVAPFALSVKIHAQLSEYSVRVFADADSVGAADSLACGDAFIISGQSNSITVRPFPELADSQSEWIRSYGDAPGYRWSGWGLAVGHNMDAPAKQGPSIGAWGWYLANSLVNRQHIPYCVINGGVGGTEIRSHLKEQNYLYVNHITRATEAGVKARIKAVLWHQGESDSFDPAYKFYAGRFDSLYHAWKSDYPALRHVYLFQIRPGCGGVRGAELREVQRNIPSSHPDIDIMSTNALGGHSYQGDFCHYYPAGYNQMASWIRPLLERDLYGSADTVGIRAPDIKSAYYTSIVRNQIALEFTQELSWGTGLTTQNWFHGITSAFLVDSLAGEIKSISADPANHRILLNLNRRFTATRVSYTPELYYPDTNITYEGPWFVNAKGIGALSFHQFPVTVPDSVSDTSLAAADTLSPDSIRFTDSARLLLPGDSLRPEIIGFYHNASGAFSRTLFSGLTWSSETPGIASVSPEGLITALTEGGPIAIVAEKDGKNDTLALSVKATPAVLKRINFQDLERATLPNWTAEMFGLFSMSRGFGWDTASYVTGQAWHDGTNGPWVVRNYVAVGNGGYGGENNQWARYRVQVPAGDYVLRLGAGNQVWVGPGGRTKDIILFKNDTLMNKGYGYCEVNTHLITITGDSGLKLNIFGAIDYLVLMSAEFKDYIDYFADDSVSGGNAPVLHTPDELIADGTAAYSPANTPNPFNPSTAIRFTLPANVRAEYSITNLLGQTVFKVEVAKSGSHVIIWGGRDMQGKSVASGVYIGRLIAANGMKKEHRMVLLK